MLSREERLRAAEERVKQNFDSRESGGSKGASVLDFTSIGGWKKGLMYRPVDRQFNRIDIIPFIVQNEQYPQKKMIGQPDYVLDLWIHRYVGPGGKHHVLCLDRNYGKPCPICEENNKLKELNAGLPKEEQIKPNYPKRRCWYSIIDLDIPEKDQKIQIFEESHYLFEKHLLLAATTRGGGFIPFFDIEEGKTIEFYANENKSPEGKFFNYERIMMVDRPSYPESIFKDAYPLDMLMVIPTYDQVRAIYYGEDSVEEQPKKEERRPSESRPSQRQPEPAEEQRRPSRSYSQREPVEEPKPERTRSERTQRREEPGCPFGHVLGKDNNEFPDCAKCDADIWDKCNDAAQEK